MRCSSRCYASPYTACTSSTSGLSSLRTISCSSGASYSSTPLRRSASAYSYGFMLPDAALSTVLLSRPATAWGGCTLPLRRR